MWRRRSLAFLTSVTRACAPRRAASVVSGIRLHVMRFSTIYDLQTPYEVSWNGGN